MVEMAPFEANILKQAQMAGDPIPERILNAPELINGLQIHLEAFFALDTERSHAMGLTPIPWTAINAYALAFDICGEQREDLFYFIRRMDNAHLEKLKEKSPTK